MATYNGAKYLREQLDSFLHQTQRPDELVVCDDGSTDATLEVLQAFSREAPFLVHIYRNEANLGYSRNFEKAISLCAGEIIFLSDQDDVWFETKIERILNEFKVQKTAWLILNDAEIVDEDLRATGLTIVGQLDSAGMDVMQLHHGCCMAFRSKLKTVLLPMPFPILSHDAWMNLFCKTVFCRCFIPDVLQLYRRHGTSTSSSFTSSTLAATRWRLLREKIKWSNIKRDPRAASNARIDQLNVIKDRLEKHRDYLVRNILDDIAMSKVISRIDLEREANESRLSIQQLYFIGRLIAGCKFYFGGGYRNFEGWKSLVRDILR